METLPVGPVLCLAISGTGEHCYSGGLDGTINCWTVPNSNIDPYDLYDPDILNCTLHGHSDAVWGLSVLNSKQQLLSCSADGTVKLWSPHSKVNRMEMGNFNFLYWILFLVSATTPVDVHVRTERRPLQRGLREGRSEPHRRLLLQRALRRFRYGDGKACRQFRAGRRRGHQHQADQQDRVSPHAAAHHHRPRGQAHQILGQPHGQDGAPDGGAPGRRHQPGCGSERAVFAIR